jgi:transcriptional regulator with XRE-family HTH domain
MTIGVFLKRYREAKGWSGRELAERMEVNPYRLQKWEEGKGSPKLEDAEKIRAYLKLSDLQTLSEEVLNNCLAGVGTAVPVDLILQQKDELLAEKEKRIKELNRTIHILEEALEAYKVKVKKEG